MPKILTSEEHERRKKEMIQQLRSISEGGIAPSTRKSKEAHYLCVRSKRYWDTWSHFCEAAGVTPRSAFFNLPERRYRPPRKPIKKGELRKAIGHFDLLDEARGEVS